MSISMLLKIQGLGHIGREFNQCLTRVCPTSWMLFFLEQEKQAISTLKGGRLFYVSCCEYVAYPMKTIS